MKRESQGGRGHGAEETLAAYVAEEHREAQSPVWVCVSLQGHQKNKYIQ